MRIRVSRWLKYERSEKRISHAGEPGGEAHVPFGHAHIVIAFLVVYHLHGNSGDSIRKVNGTSIFRRPNRNFSGINGLFEKVVLSYRLERFNR